MSVTYTQTPLDLQKVAGVKEPDKAALGFELDSYKDSSACFGFLKVLEICADVDQSRGTVTITLTAFGVQVGRWVLDREHTCIKIGLRPGVYPIAYAELDLEVCVNWSKGVYLNGKACACAALAGCTCAEFKDHYILHW